MPEYLDTIDLSQSYNPMAGFKLPTWGTTPNVVGSGLSNFSTLGSPIANTPSVAADGMKSTNWVGMGLGAVQGLGNLYMGMQQYGLAKKALAQSKEQFDKNYAAQRTTTNASLEDRQRARVASNAGAYQSVGEYMQQNGIR